MKQLAFFIVFFVVATACKEVFDVPPQSRLTANLYNSTTKVAESVVLTITPLGHDSIFYNQITDKSFFLPLSPDQSTSFRVSFDSVVDTLTFIHEKSIQYESMESGFYYQFKLKQVSSTKHRIALIQITDSLVIPILHENIKIYIRPLPSGGS